MPPPWSILCAEVEVLAVEIGAEVKAGVVVVRGGTTTLMPWALARP